MANVFWDRLVLRAVTPQTGSIYLRERVSVPSDALGPLLHRLRDSGRASEWLVLSTCGRTEVYAVATENTPSAIEDVIAASLLAVCAKETSPCAWPIRASGVDAARHLLRVAGGIESIVLGDVQLVGQLRTAYAAARAQSATGPLLNRLCQAALHAGKRARAQTGIARGAASMAAAAVHLATTRAGGMKRRRVLIVGGGQMGRAIAAVLSRQLCESVTVATRDPAAFTAAGGTRYASAVPSERAAGLFSEADVVFAVSGTQTRLLTRQLVGPAMADRATRPLLILDLAMPRQVDPGVAVVPGVALVTLNMLEAAIERATQMRSDAIADVEQIVDETLDRMLAWSPGIHRAA
jgi:glutamyl-tRNA reductase